MAKMMAVIVSEDSQHKIIESSSSPLPDDEGDNVLHKDNEDSSEDKIEREEEKHDDPSSHDPLPSSSTTATAENCSSSSTTATTVTTALGDTSPAVAASTASSFITSSMSLKRPTTLALRNRSTPRNPKCSFLSANKCLYHGIPSHKKDWSERKRNIFVKLTSLRKDKAGVITSVALKATLTRSESCDLEIGCKKDPVREAEVDPESGSAEASALTTASNVRRKVPLESLKLPTPVANNHAAATALAAGNNNIDIFDDDDEDSLPEDYISTLKLNVLIGLVVLLVVTAVGTAMLLSISKIWGNHQDNLWVDDPTASQKYLRTLSRDQDRFLHPKDLSSFLFQYEVARRQQRLKEKEKEKEETTTLTTASSTSAMEDLKIRK